MRHLSILFSAVSVLTMTACNQANQAETKTESVAPATDGKLTSDQVQKLLSEALAELDKKNFGKSVEITIRITKSDSGNVDAYLIESQAKSMSGDLKAALDSLEQAFKNGLKDLDRITKEQRFDPIRSTPEFQELLRKHGFSTTAKVGDKEVSAGNVSIKESSDGQVIKAGDITLRIPKD